EKEGRPDAARGQGLADEPGAAVAADLLVAAEGEVDRAPGPEALPEEPLCRVEGRDDHELYILRAASPDAVLREVARERIVLPFGGILGGHYVEVGAENRGGELLLASQPREQEGPVAYLLAPHSGVDSGGEALEIPLEIREGRAV